MLEKIKVHSKSTKHNLCDMMSLDIYLSYLNTEDYQKIKDTIKPQTTRVMPLLSWDLYSEHYFNISKTFKRTRDILEVKSLAEKWNWRNNIDAIFKDQSFEALIITNAERHILWVNDGFTEMTGYSKKYALQKVPGFLQGPSTCEKTRMRFREKLKANKPFTEVITNYKKDHTPYTCEVKIFPLYDYDTTHFLALEKQVV